MSEAPVGEAAPRSRVPALNSRLFLSNKAAGAQLLECEVELGLGVHDDRAAPSHRFSKRCAADE